MRNDFKNEKENINLNEMKSKSIVLIGLGPHSKRIYIHYLMKYNIFPTVIVDLESQRENIELYLKSIDKKCILYFVPDSERNNDELSIKVQEDLSIILRKYKVTHSIISTEPKAHFSYSKYLLKSGINTLVDKPITSPPNVSTDIKMAMKIEEDYDVLRQLYVNNSNEDIVCQVQCQRRWHKGYIYVKEILKSCIQKYHVPITMMDVYHCDGMWNMPDEFLFRENHPYKYGYGKLFHSGYHFIDIMCWLVELNQIIDNKKIDTGKITSSVTRPYDFLNMIDNNFYNNILETSKFDHIYKDIDKHSLKEYGEIDVHSIIQFYSNNSVVTTCSVNLMQNGFSRRAWTDLPEDTYKSNGRVRHERINIQVGPLLNIQIHSYQSKEIRDRTKDDFGRTGTLEHFDIDIFRNVDIIGGQPYERITISDLCKIDDEQNFIGYNESAREDCILEFLSSQKDTSDLMDHSLSIKVLSNNYKSICNSSLSESTTIEFSV